ncbi:unnamed protein product, partial [Thelazia callipaeda]|uniref:GLOBIN domain-containing protein n=1 Tax=Thelazia callipaeda TaxID=103827 RepID=A0A0N5DBD2_THECL
CPEAQRLFTFTIPPRGQERQCNEFAFQALRFIQILESGINNLNNLKAIEPILDNLGRRHGKLKSSVGFRPYYWTVFMECTIHHLRLAFLNSKVDQWSHKDIDNAIMLWRHLILGICQRIKVKIVLIFCYIHESKKKHSCFAVF